MAAFTWKEPANRQAFEERWARIRADQGILIRTILVEDRVAGSVLSFDMFGDLSVSYWLGREFWGRGIATSALGAFIKIQNKRPLYARAASDNIGSLRVLEKCSFRVTGKEMGNANARGCEIEEFILMLES